MKKIIACILAPLLIVLLPTALFAAAGDTVYVKSFGLMPNTRENAVKIIQSALDSCRTKKNPVLFFEKGRYDFWPQYSIEKEYFESNTTEINPKRCPIWIYAFKNLTIDANGSDFIYHDRVQPFTIDQSQDITIKNVQIDWDIPLTAQASVKDTSAHYIDLQIDSSAYPFIIEKGKLFFTGEGWKSRWWDCMEFDKSSHMIVPQTGDDGVLGSKWEQYTAIQLSANTIRLNYGFKRKPAIGNILVMRHNERDHAGIFITQSKNIHLANIYLFQTAGLGILAQYSENLDYSNIQVVPNAAKGRYFSGHDDGCHFSNCKGQILIDHCSFTGLMDDPINVHGTAVQIIQKKSATELLCRFMHEQSIGMVWAQAGDTVGFINHTSMQTKTYGIVASFTALNTTDFIIHFKENITEEIAVKDALENISWTPHITIRNSVFGVNRARGILISTPGKVIVEDNIFESSGSAILIAGDANQWFETGAVKDVLIQRNVFKDACLTSMYQFCEAIISIDPEIPVIDKNTPFHRNIVITNNQFNPYDYPVLYAKSVEGLTFTNNTITRSNRFTPFHTNKNMFSLLACKKVSIGNNQLNGDVLGKNILLQKMTIKDISIQPANSLAIEQR